MVVAEASVILTPADIARALASVRPPSPGTADGGVQADTSADAPAPDSFRLPADAVHLIGPLLERLAAGQIVTLVPTHAEFTPEGAADLLNVSPSFVTRLIDQGELPARTVGPHQRVLYGDVMAYKRRSAAAAEEAVRELTQLSQELGLY